WNTCAMGTYRLTLQLGQQVGGTINHLSDAPPVIFFIDNNAPTVGLNIARWRELGGVWHNLPADCALMARRLGVAIEVQVDVTVAASHLREVVISASGCGSGATPVPSSVDFWHRNELDNTWSDSRVYSIPAGAPAGCYTWYVTASSRAFNPSGDNN